MCKEHAHLASTTGTSLPPAPELVHMRALEEQVKKNPGLRQKLQDWANKLTSIIL